MLFPLQAYTFRPIGILHTAFTKKYHAPRQPILFNTDTEQHISEQYQQTQQQTGQQTERLSSGGVIRLLPHCNYEQALADLEGSERIWLVFVFHHNLTHWKPKVLPPTTGRTRKKRGVFATRAPYRPNPIGISPVTLQEIRGLEIVIGHSDLLDGTPILDIKPYLPLYDAFPTSRAPVWWEEARKAEHILFSLHCTPKASLMLDFLAARGVLLLEHVRTILCQDPFPHPYRRITRLANDDSAMQNSIIRPPNPRLETYVVAYQDWRILYALDSLTLTIYDIQSAYTAENPPPKEVGYDVHQDFQVFRHSYIKEHP